MLIAQWYKIIRSLSSLLYPGSPFWRTVIYQASVMAAEAPLPRPCLWLNSMAANGHRGHCVLPTNDPLWKWWDAINFLAKRRFKEENLTLAAADYVLEKLSQDGTRIAGKSDSFVYVVISHLLEDFRREKFGHPRMPTWITEKPLYREVMQIIRGNTGNFNCQTVINNLHEVYPATHWDDLVDTVLTVKAYYLLMVQGYSRQETVNMWQTVMPEIPKSVLENIATTLLNKCSPRIPVTLEDQEGDDEDPLEELVEEEEQRLQNFLVKWILRSNPETDLDLDLAVKKYLSILRSVPLREADKIILTLRYYHDLPAKEIANSDFGQANHLTDKKIFKIANAALEKLRKILKEHGLI